MRPSIALALGENLGPERAPDQLRSSQRRKGGIVGVALQEVGEARDAVENRTNPDEAVIPAPQMRAHGIERDVGRRGDQMLLVHGNRSGPETEDRSGEPWR